MYLQLSSPLQPTFYILIKYLISKLEDPHLTFYLRALFYIIPALAMSVVVNITKFLEVRPYKMTSCPKHIFLTRIFHFK